MLKFPSFKAFYLFVLLLILTPSFSGRPLASGSVILEKKEIKDVRLAEYTKDKPQIRLNKKGIQFVNKYLRNSNECLTGVKKRSTIPFIIIDSVLALYRLPVELKYLAVIESELKPSALSHVGARGPWQLMPATAQILGLKVTSHNDERTNYYKSTIAAAKYLRDLYAQFNDWLLVLAAYNGGPRPVLNAMKVSGSKNFWVLQNYLPAESRDHVKKFIATHYFFEGRGSETTLTHAENLAYKKMVKAFIISRSIPVKENSKSEQTAYHSKLTNNSISDYDLQKLLGFDYQSKNISSKYSAEPTGVETLEQKFKRLMAESGECLKKSRKVI